MVREALTRLTEKDLVVATPQRGFRVRELSVSDVQALAEARAQIESLTLQLAIERGDIHWETRVLASHHLLDKTPLLLDDGQCNGEWVARHQAFHRALLSGCGNPRLVELCLALRDCGELYRTWYRAVPDYGSHDIGEHRRLTDLTLARDSEAAVTLLRTHIERTPLKLVAYVAEHGAAPVQHPSS